jgi:hypothetical protein
VGVDNNVTDVIASFHFKFQWVLVPKHTHVWVNCANGNPFDTAQLVAAWMAALRLGFAKRLTAWIWSN